ncbi:MAG: alcohol dehydrogenase [Thermoprotei archaeon]|nr:MAG: alcohol dehydrogenase [Thermoprotei archaeon]
MFGWWGSLRSFQVYNGGVKLFFGVNSLEEAAAYLRKYSRVLIITGRTSAKLSGALDDIIRILESSGVEYEVWSKALPNPTDELVAELVEVYRSGVFEGFIAIGGGSVIDLAKAARVVVAGGGSVREYLYGAREIPRTQPFLFAVNLTHGTGTEIDRYAVVTITETKEKLGFSPGYPDVSVDDPKYTASLPRRQTIYTSLDAFAHAVESATSAKASPYTEMLAEEAVKHVIEYLPRALEKPKELEYRYWLLYASMIAGIGIDHGVTHYGHAIEHVLTGSRPELAHGAGLAILYRELIKFFYEYSPVVMSRLLKPLDPSLKPIREDSAKAVKAYIDFLDKIGFRETLSDYGFTVGEVRELKALYFKLVEKRYESLLPFKLQWEQVESMLKNLV